MDCTACTEPQCLYSTAIPLLPLWTVRPVQSLSACTVLLYLYSPMDFTTCTDPQCLYSTAIPLLPQWTVRPVQSLNANTPVKIFPWGDSNQFLALYASRIHIVYILTVTWATWFSIPLLFAPNRLHSRRLSSGRHSHFSRPLWLPPFVHCCFVYHIRIISNFRDLKLLYNILTHSSSFELQLFSKTLERTLKSRISKAGFSSVFK